MSLTDISKNACKSKVCGAGMAYDGRVSWKREKVEILL